MTTIQLYRGGDPRDKPRYSYPEAARATGVPTTTIGAWVRGQAYRRKDGRGRFKAVIKRPSTRDSRLSYHNLIEVHVLRALRVKHEVHLQHVRHTITLAEKEFGVQRLLISPELCASAGKLFLNRYSHLVELSTSAQFAMRSILDQYLERVSRDDAGLPREFFPLERSPRNQGAKPVMVSPFVAFGQPIIGRVGVTTAAIAERVNCGETQQAIIEDYGLEGGEFEEALLYEAAA